MGTTMSNRVAYSTKLLAPSKDCQDGDVKWTVDKYNGLLASIYVNKKGVFFMNRTHGVMDARSIMAELVKGKAVQQKQLGGSGLEGGGQRCTWGCLVNPSPMPMCFTRR